MPAAEVFTRGAFWFPGF